MGIQSSSAVLKAYFETGDVPTAAQFGEFIDSTAYYDYSLEKLFLSASGTGSMGNLSVKSIHPYTGSHTSIIVSASLIPPFDTLGTGKDLGAILTPWKHIYAASASIDHLNARTGSVVTVSGGLAPLINNLHDLGTTNLKWKHLHVSGINADYISSSLKPDQNNLRDLGSAENKFANIFTKSASIEYISGSGTLGTNIHIAKIDQVSGTLLPFADNVFDLGSAAKSFKDLHVQGTATIGTLALGSIGEMTITTASLTVISSSRIDGIGGYGNIIISGGLVPGTTNKFDLGTSEKKWKSLYVSGAAIDAVSSSLIPDQDNLRDLGSSAKEWKDLYIDGTANIDTLAADTGTVNTITVTTASLTIISSSRIDGVGGYGNIIISGGLIPGTTNKFNLGTTTKQWQMLHVSGVNIGAVSSSLIPDQDNLRDLGSSAKEWKDLYIDGTAKIDTLTSDTASIGRIGSELTPITTNTYSLGRTDFKFKDIHVISSSIDYVSSSLNPHKTSTYDLGSSTLQWRSASIKHITASTIIVDNLIAKTTTFTLTNTITGSNQFGSGSTNTNSFSGSITAVTNITASGNISASGTISAATFNFGNSTILTNQLTVTSSVWVSGSGQNVYLMNDGTISASSTISSSGTIKAEHFFSSDDALITDNLIAGSINSPGIISSSTGFNTIGGFVNASDVSGSVKIVSGGIFHSRAEGASADNEDYTIHGRRFTVKNQLQAALPASQSSGIFTVNNYSVQDGDVVMGTFMGLTGGGTGTLSLSASIHCFTTASLSRGFAFYIHNNKTTTIADNSDFTASFVVL